MHDTPDFATFERLAQSGRGNLIPICRRVLEDQLTPVLAYRRLVRPDPRMAPSFLLESVVGGERVGRYSFLGAQPIAELIARRDDVRYVDHRGREKSATYRCDDPLGEMARLTKGTRLANLPELPAFTGGWVGLTAYDSVRYLEREKLADSPRDDRSLPDVHMQLYN